MKLFKNHKTRVEKVRSFGSKNKIFVITAIVAVVFLLANFVFNVKDKPPHEGGENAAAEIEPLSWRFYPIDLAILGVGGGFCTVMIIRQRKKTKEELK